MFGWTALLLTLWGTIAQFRRTLRLGVEGVSLATWTLFVLMGCFWIVYGIDQRSAIIVLGSLLILPMQLAIVFRLRPWRSWPATRVVAGSIIYVFVLSVLPTFFWGWPGGVYGAGVVMVLSRGPQIIELIRDPDVTGVSVKTWAMVAAGGACWIVYYENARLWAALVSTACAGVASLAIAVLAAWRQRQARRQAVSAGVIFSTT